MDLFVFLVDELGYWAIIIGSMLLCVQLGLWINRDTVNRVITFRNGESEHRKNLDSLARTLDRNYSEVLVPLTERLKEREEKHEDDITRLILSNERKNRMIEHLEQENKKLRSRR